MNQLNPRLRRVLEPALDVWITAILVVAYLPMALWSAAVVFAIRAYWYLGYWPSYNQPDPMELPDDFAPGTLWLEFVVPLLYLLLGVAASLFLLRSLAPKRMWMLLAVGIMVCAWTGTIILLRYDPGGIGDWIND